MTKSMENDQSYFRENWSQIE